MKPFLQLYGLLQNEETEESVKPEMLVKRVSDMIDERKTLKSNVANMKHVMVNSVLFGLIRGNIDKANNEVLDILDENNVSFDCYDVILLDYLDIQAKVEVDSLFETMDTMGFKVYCVEEDTSNRITVIITCKQEDRGNISAFIERLHRHIFEKYGFYPTIGVGMIYSDAMYLSQSYIEAEVAVEQSFIIGEGRIIKSNDVFMQSNGNIKYPSELLAQINRNIQSANYQKTTEAVDALFAMFTRESYPIDMVKCLSYHIIITIMNTVSHNRIGLANTKYKDFDVTEIVKIRYISQLKTVVDELIEILQNGDDAEEDGEGFQARCMEYINSEYKNPDFSVKKMSADLNYSAGYMMRAFKNIFGVTILECVTEIRMKKAIELLSETDMMVSDIAREVGYIQAVTFNRNFKNYTGVTPSEYRK